MSNEFSPLFEKKFRGFFTLYVIMFIIYNAFIVITGIYRMGDNDGSFQNLFLLNVITTSIIGMVVLIWSYSIPKKVKQSLPINHISLFFTLTLIYYFLPFLVFFLGNINSILTPERLINSFIYIMVTSLPFLSIPIIMYYVHRMYYLNIVKYNTSLNTYSSEQNKS
jgi:hypothetical protein